LHFPSQKWLPGLPEVTAGCGLPTDLPPFVSDFPPFPLGEWYLVAGQ